MNNIKKYKDIFIGSTSFFYFIKYELFTTLFDQIPGALGLFLKKAEILEILRRLQTLLKQLFP
ncbi:unnamed protein product [marine sediment metagenome]|uniref:Uncharacterized protein n=1 Tax=marine sediment metagenome TaxID=412755 RepID=X0ZBC7_9ZZZZ